MYMASAGAIAGETLSAIVGHFLSVREGETARTGLQTSPRSPLVVFFPTALCSTA